jgi:hypothetical protein
MRLTRILLAALVAVVITAPAASASADRKLGELLGALWETALETPLGAEDPCVDLGGVVAPFQPSPDPLTCTVEFGDRIFVAAATVECSNAEPDPFFGRNEAELRSCAHRQLEALFSAVTVKLDGRPVELTRVQTSLLRVDLPEDNILGTGDRSAKSVGEGWVALLDPLPPGTHDIRINFTLTLPGEEPQRIRFTTTIVVEPGRWSAAG